MFSDIADTTFSRLLLEGSLNVAVGLRISLLFLTKSLTDSIGF